MARFSQAAMAAVTAAWIGCCVASAQAPVRTSARALDPDAGISGQSAPDPLTPPEAGGPAPLAPGAPAASPANAAQEVDPVVALVRERLAAPPSRGNAAEREDYAGLAAFYAEGNGQPVWTSTGGFSPRAQQAIAEIRKADDWGLKASDFDLPSAPNAANPSARADAEIKLGLAVLKYGRQARGGRLDPSAVSHMFDVKPSVYQPKSLMQAIAAADSADAYLRDLHPRHPQFQRLREALIAARGGRTPSEATAPDVMIPRGPRITPGQEHPHVALVRQRLAATGEAGREAVYDAALVDEVRAFQRRSDLEPTGVIDGALRNALNGGARQPASENVARLIANIERWRWLPPDLGEFYVWDSVPEQMTSVFSHGRQVFSEKIVVGKPSTPTPIFSALMQFIVFHPSWSVPPGMKTQELLPELRSTGGWFFGTSASAVLGSHGLQVSRGGRTIDPDSVNWQSVDIRAFDFTQPPGPRNVLGIVKFRFPNKHDVYMHDTPERNLFGGSVRAFSHGCMRVQNPVRLAETVLAYDKGWTADKVQELVHHGGEIKLDKPIPVHITYFTMAVDDSGKLHSYGDIYGLDARVASALNGHAVHLASAAVGAEPRATEGGDEQPGRKHGQRLRKKAPSPFSPFSW
jgi:murein L,D-transpeptidase YcbB/YkuD